MLRSMLFTPGNRADLITKAFASGADAIIVDLEDAVPVSSKAQARENLQRLAPGPVPTFTRVNAADTEFFWADVVAAAAAGVAGIVLPKADDPRLMQRLDGALTALEVQSGRQPGSTTLMPLIESSLGVARARKILASSPRVSSVLFGSGEQGDLVVDLGCEWTPDGAALLAARSLVLIAARSVGIEHPLDAVFMDFRNLEALRIECELAKRIGYVGKVAIHPAQIPIIHAVFTPSPEEISQQEKLLATFDDAVANGSASINIDGRMVDYAVARRARSILARAGALRTTPQP